MSFVILLTVFGDVESALLSFVLVRVQVVGAPAAQDAIVHGALRTIRKQYICYFILIYLSFSMFSIRLGHV